MSSASRISLAFVGDDFTGSTDALESLALLGVRVALFTGVPTRDEAVDLDAIGVATRARAMTPDEMTEHLGPVFVQLAALGVKRVHYKVCSTFDSSSLVGSIGRAIELGMAALRRGPVPVVGGAPDLGRYCIFGNLFARFGDDPIPYRIDRHPSMSRHPTTPMDEADLRVHLSKQTNEPIDLIPLQHLRTGRAELRDGVTLIDAMHNSDHALIGQLIARARFVVGPSSVGTSLVKCDDVPRNGAGAQKAPAAAGPIVVACGSCSPVTARQIANATSFVTFVVRPDSPTDRDAITRALASGQSVILHTDSTRPLDAALASATLASTVRDVLHAVPLVKRLLLCGGDTSGDIARALGVSRIRFAGTLVRGAPLCTVRSTDPRFDRMEMVFKGGQIGPDDFFIRVRDGATKE
jgi:3-oxoisoapionate kinase